MKDVNVWQYVTRINMLSSGENEEVKIPRKQEKNSKIRNIFCSPTKRATEASGSIFDTEYLSVKQLSWTHCGWSEIHVVFAYSFENFCSCRLTTQHWRTRPCGCQCHISWSRTRPATNTSWSTPWKHSERENKRFQGDRITSVTFRWWNSGCKIASSRTAKHNPRATERLWLVIVEAQSSKQSPSASWALEIFALDSSSVSESKR